VVKKVNGAAPAAGQSFTFQLRQGATKIIGHPGTILDTQAATSGNAGVINFTDKLIPGQVYQLCEVLPGVAWKTNLGPNPFTPEQFLADGTTPNDLADNSVVCANFTATVGPDPLVLNVNNTPPPGGNALTIGYWKNWASCAASNGKKKPVLDQTLAAAQAANGGLVVSATSGTFPTFGITFYLVLHGSTSSPNVAPDCKKAVSLLNKSNFSGAKKASDPAFNMAAQLVAAELNYVAGAGEKAAATTAINQAVLILGKYHFDGTGYLGKITAADAATMNGLAKTLDLYNNNLI
jgi:hypothetical protein